MARVKQYSFVGINPNTNNTYGFDYMLSLKDAGFTLKDLTAAGQSKKNQVYIKLIAHNAWARNEIFALQGSSKNHRCGLMMFIQYLVRARSCPLRKFHKGHTRNVIKFAIQTEFISADDCKDILLDLVSK